MERICCFFDAGYPYTVTGCCLWLKLNYLFDQLYMYKYYVYLLMCLDDANVANHLRSWFHYTSQEQPYPFYVQHT